MESKDDLKSLKFWRAVIAEFVGCIFLVLVTCGAWIETDNEEHPMTVRVSVASGLAYAIVLYVMRAVSGGHGNPAVSMAMLVTRKISVARALLYVLSQCLGAILGAAILYGLTASNYLGSLGCTVLAYNTTEGQAFGVEFFATCFLVFVVFAAYEKEGQKASGPIFIGLTLTAASLFTVPYTGGSFNPARSFGPAVVQSVWIKHWIYWFGPLLGGIVGGLLYDGLFAKQATISRLHACALAYRKRESAPDQAKVECSPAERVALKGDILASTEDLEEVEEGKFQGEDNEGVCVTPNETPKSVHFTTNETASARHTP